MKEQMLSLDRIISEQELKKLLRETEKEKNNSVQSRRRFKFINDHFLFSLAANTGLRIHEMSLLKWCHIHDDYLKVQRGKGGKKRDVFYGPATKKLLDEFKTIQGTIWRRPCGTDDYLFIGQRHERLKRGGIHLRWKYWLRRTGIRQDLGFHSLRHFYGTHSIEAGIPLSSLRSNMGHGSISTTGIYLHLTKTGREAIAKVY